MTEDPLSSLTLYVVLFYGIIDILLFCDSRIFKHEHFEMRVIVRLLCVLSGFIWVNGHISEKDIVFINGMWCAILLFALVDALDAAEERLKKDMCRAVALHEKATNEERSKVTEGEWRAGYYEMCGFGKIVR